MSLLLRLLRERIRPVLTTEEQLVVVCHLVGPFLQRFSSELARKVFDVTIELYEALAKVSILLILTLWNVPVNMGLRIFDDPFRLERYREQHLSHAFLREHFRILHLAF